MLGCMRRLFPVLVLAGLLLGCPASNTLPQAQEPLDPAPFSVGVCTLAQTNLLKLGCKDHEGRPLGGPNKAGQTFAAVCQNAVANHVNINPSCIATVKVCAEVDSCPR